MALIECQNVSFAYDEKTVLRGLNFAVEAGDYLCVAGENGSGKSTLIKGLLRLIRPSQGFILMDKSLRAEEIGYMPQQTAVQKDFPAGVFEVALSGRQNRRGFRPFYSRQDKDAAAETLAHLGLEGLRRACYRELSGGQQRRVLLARALCASRKLLILDEPASGLDPLVTADMYRLLSEINRDLGITLVMVSHDVGSAVLLADKILHLQNEQLFFGTAAAYRESAPGRRFLGNAGEARP
ncbi:MAG: metal ABC transporter ATP-binding protein [Treponema sp.]|jgi:zinc transport system ATP-binding protein|nr:metal ABC transporter ATP-binding protein [Treponema sp.]